MSDALLYLLAVAAVRGSMLVIHYAIWRTNGRSATATWALWTLIVGLCYAAVVAFNAARAA